MLLELSLLDYLSVESDKTVLIQVAELIQNVELVQKFDPVLNAEMVQEIRRLAVSIPHW